MLLAALGVRAEGNPTAGVGWLMAFVPLWIPANVFLMAVALVRRLPRETRILRERDGWRLTFLPAILGTYFGILAMQVGIANLDLGVASTLLATSPIFVIPVAWIVAGERPTLRRTVGAVVATGGVAMISLAG